MAWDLININLKRMKLAARSIKIKHLRLNGIVSGCNGSVSGAAILWTYTSITQNSSV